MVPVGAGSGAGGDAEEGQRQVGGNRSAPPGRVRGGCRGRCLRPRAWACGPGRPGGGPGWTRPGWSKRCARGFVFSGRRTRRDRFPPGTPVRGGTPPDPRACRKPSRAGAGLPSVKATFQGGPTTSVSTAFCSASSPRTRRPKRRLVANPSTDSASSRLSARSCSNFAVSSLSSPGISGAGISSRRTSSRKSCLMPSPFHIAEGALERQVADALDEVGAVGGGNGAAGVEDVEEVRKLGCARRRGG